MARSENPTVELGPGPQARRAWCILLAGGDGHRLGELTTFGNLRIPKQFCAFGSDASLLELARRRARRLVPDERIVTVVTEGHRRWWRDELADQPPSRVVVQPSNRGTAAGVLLPLSRILAVDPGATVVLLPSDHHVADEWTLATAAQAAVAAAAADPGRLYLLGVSSDLPDPGLGWIVPSRPESMLRPAPVAAFREKPTAGEAEALLARGAVANTFILAADGAKLREAFETALPQLAARFRDGRAGLAGPEGLEALYADLPTTDFSRHVVERLQGHLAVIRVPPCGWNDLGTPEAVARVFYDAPRQPRAQVSLVRPPAARQDPHLHGFF